MNNSIQKELVLSTLRKLANHPSVDEIYLELHKTYKSISKATVYRDLKSLEKENKVLKIDTPKQELHYDHNTHKHYHVQCKKCSRVFDVELKENPKLMDLIKDSFGFDIDSFNLIFQGLCPDCQK